MSYGIIEYNNLGLPKCELCGKFFSRVLPHVRQKHNLSARVYKELFGFDLIKGIISNESKLKSREAVLRNYEEVVRVNLIENGKKTRYKPGYTGRTSEQVSEQTRLMLIDRAKNSMTTEQRSKQCKELGLSGLGNKKRWGNNGK